ncbi:thymidylate synthase/dCMP hydroxymethylase domain-containing protein [Apiosordaria backusii]|uniref:Thymidylate synthase n=1 Tax=Apiosordaria backusii TaxID=314023 RepID=A0AA40DR43_9PEZI|nr:thymidylate synthase/dCMP hydroxymethylase domain-containing protein [Apiosordaria backusii]
MTVETPSTTPAPAAPPAATTTTPSPSSAPPKRHEEHQYLDLVRDILENGELRRDRTGTGTYSLFAPPPLKFSLSSPTGNPLLPLLTTKRVFTRAIILELLWFISGSTSSTPLSSQNVKIWDGNGSRSFLDSLGLTHRSEGDLGPVYGFQWRHFGAEYIDSSTDYTNQGVDQLARIVHTLKTNPYDRRLILSAWNPKDLPQMVLPPCHMFAQFYVSYPRSRKETEEGKGVKGHLHCQLYQRSCDMGLGVPFNIASYALLTHMLAHVCDLVPGSLTHVMGDAHVYLNHVDALTTQLEREPRDFPELEIKREKGGSIDGWKLEDFEIKGYNPHKVILMEMSV